MRRHRPFRFRLLHVVEALAVISIAGIFAGLKWLELSSYGRWDPTVLIPTGLLFGYLALRRAVLIKL